jgi:hypothetical protein
MNMWEYIIVNVSITQICKILNFNMQILKGSDDDV